MAVATLMISSVLGFVFGMISWIVGLGVLTALAVYFTSSIGLGLLVLLANAFSATQGTRALPAAAMHG